LKARHDFLVDNDKKQFAGSETQQAAANSTTSIKEKIGTAAVPAKIYHHIKDV
jgi:hypothetical protein